MSVVDINGNPVQQLGEPNTALVEKLEEMLAMARSGSIVAAANVMVFADGACVSGWVNPPGGQFSSKMCVGASVLAHRMIALSGGNSD